MKRISSVIAGTALLSSLAGNAGAATLYTAPVDGLAEPNASTTHRLCCDILNISSATRNVSIEIRTRSAAVVLSAGPIPLPSQAGTSRCVTAATAAYCQFDVESSSRHYRALAIYDAGGAYRISLPAR